MSIRTSTVDTRIKQIRPLIPPACLLEELPCPNSLIPFLRDSRQQIADIIHHRDDRLFVVIGPCSIHDTQAAIEYATRLSQQMELYRSTLFIAMRVYFEKPRTTIGWKGLINDPTLDGSYAINKGLRIARQLMLDINHLSLPIACEMLDTITPQFISDLVSWAAIGARTSESQLHRELVSGLSYAVGFKNGTQGSKKIAIDAIIASQSPHCFLSVTSQGLAAIVETQGNQDTHIVLRGSETNSNYSREHITETCHMLRSVFAPISIMIDCSHGNSNKKHDNQPLVINNICEQISLADDNSDSIIGVMIESNLNEGNQKLIPGNMSGIELKYGVSVTDACIGWNTTEIALRQLHEAVLNRRKNKGNTAVANGHPQ